VDSTAEEITVSAPFGGDIDAEAPFVIRRAQVDGEDGGNLPQGVGGRAVDEYVAEALERLRAQNHLWTRQAEEMAA
jgi:hypothetical protein